MFRPARSRLGSGTRLLVVAPRPTRDGLAASGKKQLTEGLARDSTPFGSFPCGLPRTDPKPLGSRSYDGVGEGTDTAKCDCNPIPGKDGHRRARGARHHDVARL